MAADGPRAGWLEATNTWRQEMRSRIKAARERERIDHDTFGVSDRTLSYWTGLGSCAPPTMTNLRRIASALRYPLVQQLIDMEEIQTQELDAFQPMLTMSQTLLIDQISRITEVATSLRPSVVDVGQAVMKSCTETGHFGRWRARMFDVVGGQEFRYVAHHGVEFLRWYGPGGSQQQESLDGVRDLVEQFVPPDRLPDYATPAVWSNAPTIAAYERAELGWRARNVLPLMFTNSYGSHGDVHAPLVHRSNPSIWRHIYLEPSGSRTLADPSLVRRVHPDLQSSPGRVLLLAPPQVGGVALGRLIGHALGWDTFAGAEVTGRMVGRRLRTSHGEDRTSANRQALRLIATRAPNRPTLTVLSAMTPLVLDGGGGEQEGSSLKLADEAKEVLAAEGVLTIVVRPGAATDDSSTNGQWTARQRRMVQSGGQPQKDNLADTAQRNLDAVATFCKDSGVNYAIYDLRLAVPWNAKDSFEDPQIGDVRLRAAYEIAYLIMNGSPPSPARGRPLRPCYFVPGSALALHEDQLARTTKASTVLKIPKGRTDLVP